MAQTTAKKERPIVVPSAVRRWAKSQGIQLGTRGRLPDEVIQAYRARPKPTR